MEPAISEAALPSAAHFPMTWEQMVLSKEEGVREARRVLKNISEALQAAEEIPSKDFDRRNWLATLESIEDDDKRFKYTVGVAGDTGMGKTSLLNALIDDTGDVAPKSQRGSCTAVVCAFQYHDATATPERKYLAKIKFKTLQTVESELFALFQEIRDFEARVQVEGMDSIAQAEQVRLIAQLETVSGWSKLPLNTIKSGNVEDILSQCADAHVLFDYTDPRKNRLKEVAAPKSKEFLRKVRPFVGATGNTDTLRWPLVESVLIYLPSKILKDCHGLELVDLPGEMDALESRSQIARQFYNNLDAMMIVTPADRARDNRTASDLIRDDRIHDLEADGKIDDSIAVVISKVDQLQWQEYVTDEVSPQSISEEFPAMWADFDEKEQSLQGTRDDIEELRNEIVESEEEDEDDEDRQVKLEELHEAEMLERKLSREVTTLEANCRQLCIKARSRDDIQGLQEYFDSIRNSERASNNKVQTKLPVFPVSSKAQRSLMLNKPEQGFPDDTTTGFVPLKGWIIHGSLSKREEHADNVLHRCLVLFDAIDAWVYDKAQQPSEQLPEEQLEELQNTLNKIAKTGLEKHVKYPGNNLLKTFARSPLLPMMKSLDSQLSEELAERFPRTVYEFKLGDNKERMHWSTYAACIRRNGGMFTTHSIPRKKFCWIGRLFNLYWGRRSGLWATAFVKRLPQYYRDHTTRDIQRIISSHINDLQTATELPLEFKKAFAPVAYQAENILREYQAKVQEAITKFRMNTTETRRASTEAFTTELSAAFAQASDIIGKGKHKKQTQLIEKFGKDNGFAVISNVDAIMDKQLAQARGTLSKSLTNSANDVTRKIRKLDERIAKSVCTKSNKAKYYVEDTAQIADLKSGVEKELKNWNKFWDGLKPVIPPLKIEAMDIKTEEEIMNGGFGGDDDDAQGPRPQGSKPPRKKPGPKAGTKRAAPKQENNANENAKKPKTGGKVAKSVAGGTATAKGSSVGPDLDFSNIVSNINSGAMQGQFNANSGGI